MCVFHSFKSGEAKPSPILVLLLRDEDLPQVTPPPKVIPQLLLCNVLCKTCEVKCRYVALIPSVLSTISLLLSIVACCRCLSRILVEARSTSLSYLTSSPLSLPPTVSLSTHTSLSGVTAHKCYMYISFVIIDQMLSVMHSHLFSLFRPQECGYYPQNIVLYCFLVNLLSLCYV